MLEEAYLYVNMPEPAFGIQLVYTDARTPELAVVVREGDCVLTAEGYHPNVAAPGGPINFLWMMGGESRRRRPPVRWCQRPAGICRRRIGARQGTCPEVIRAPLDEGQERIAVAGDVLHFAPHVVHGATMLDEEVVLMDIFTPIREDFLTA